LQGRISLEAQLSALQKAGSVKDTIIMELQNKQKMMQGRIETYDGELKQLRGGH